jgi:hypothetical protein
MSRTIQLKVALVALLVGAATLSHRTLLSNSWSDDWFSIVLLPFGIVNVIFSTPGTIWVRATAIGIAFGGLLWPRLFGGLALLFAWLAWPPLYIGGWALEGRGDRDPNVRQDSRSAATWARIAVAAIIGAVAIASLVYRILVARRLQQTAALFIGIPAILAIVVVFAVSPRSAVGVACKAVTVGLLVSMIFLGEGMLCVAQSAPLFYAVAVAIATTRDWTLRRNEKSATTVYSCVVLLALLPMSLEGVTGLTTLNRGESVTVTKIVRGSAQSVERALFEPPRFERARPLYLRAGFPSPVSSAIERVAGGTRWVIQVRGGEMRLNGMEARAGDLILDLEEARPGMARWRAVSDTSHMTHFLNWRESVVRWEAVDAHTTKVTWTLRYDRGLDPAWYFGPMEQYAVRLAAGYLIDAVATP